MSEGRISPMKRCLFAEDDVCRTNAMKDYGFTGNCVNCLLARIIREIRETRMELKNIESKL